MGAFSIALILYGVLHMLSGRTNYENYWGGLVFAPFTIVIGIVLLCGLAFRFDRFPALSGGNNRRGAAKMNKRRK